MILEIRKVNFVGKLFLIKGHQELALQYIFFRFPCNHCDYKATTSSHLKKHKESVHEGIKYKCNECEHESTTKEQYRKINVSKKRNLSSMLDPVRFYRRFFFGISVDSLCMFSRGYITLPVPESSFLCKEGENWGLRSGREDYRSLLPMFLG